jgi:plastocyanin
MSRGLIVLFAAIALIVVLLTACGGGAGGGGAPLSVTVTATEFKFDPATINATPGQTINLTVKNSGAVQHTWVVTAANVKITVDPGKTETKTFTAPAAGTYPIECDVAGHKEAGMVGQLIVK